MLPICPVAQTIILIDEVEAIAINRSAASLKANPVDVHRATDALLAGLDRLATECQRLLIIATTNFTTGVDEAFTSRADAVFQFPLPDREVAAFILQDTLKELGRKWPHFIDLAGSERLGELVEGVTGLDGRGIRKTVVQAIGSRIETATDPSTVSMDDLLTAARFMREHRIIPNEER